MLRIDRNYFIRAPRERVWAALTDVALMAKWTGTAAQFEARVGGVYALWDDYVRGEVLVCDAPNKLSQTWQPNNWAIQDSVVTFTLKKSRGGTALHLVHENVQPEDFDGTANGWDEYYIGALKAMLESEKPKARAKPKPKPVKRTTQPKKKSGKHKTHAREKTLSAHRETGT